MERRDIGGFMAAGLCAGFDQGASAQEAGRTTPVCARLEAEAGRYRLRVRLRAERDVAQALLFSGRRRLLWRGALCAGEEIEVNAACMTHPFFPGGTDEPTAADALELALAGDGAQIVSAQAERAQMPAVLMLGDSTVTDQRALSPYAPGAAYCGWGQMLGAYLDGACTGNFARSGLTVETIVTEGLYDLMKAQMKRGDLVLIQFGHNDQKRPHLTAAGGFAQGLGRFVRELRALGARPVLITPLARNSWWNEGEYCDLLRAFAQETLAVGRRENVPVIDLHALMMDRLIRTGRDAAKPLFHTGDYTHTNDFGAYLAAGFVAGELARLGLTTVRALEPWPPHGPYDEPASDQGDEALPPTGLEALYRQYETAQPDAPLSRQEGIELICRTCGLFAHNGEAALPADVPRAEAFSESIRCAAQHRLIDPVLAADGRLHPYRAMTQREFAQMLKTAYGMRCSAQHIAPAGEGVMTRAQAAALCRAARI